MQKRVILLILVLLLSTLACSLFPAPSIGPISPPTTTTSITSTVEASPTIEPSATNELITQTPPSTPTQIFTATAVPPSPTATAVQTPVPMTSFYLQSGTPLGMPNFANPTAGCNWMGVVGQVFNNVGEPLSGYVLQVGGGLAGREISQMALTGGAPQVGPGGFMLVLADHPIESDGSLWIQLFDQAGLPKTGKILLTTYSNCERNLILINLVELKTIITRVMIPFVNK